MIWLYIILGFNVPIILFIIFLLIQILLRYINYHNKSTLNEVMVNDTKASVPDCPPALVSYYINDKKLFLKGRIATVMDLISRGYIEVKKSKSENFNEYKLKASNKDNDGLCKYELIILELLKEEMDTKTLLKYINGKRNYKKELMEFENLISYTEKPRFSYNNSKLITKERSFANITKIISGIPGAIILIWGNEEFSSFFDFFAILVGIPMGIVFFIIWLFSGVDLHYVLYYIAIFSAFSYVIFLAFSKLQNILLDINEYYSTFSLAKEKEYREWIGFKRALKKSNTEYNKSNAESFYGYATIFGCDKKFFYNSIKNREDISMLEYFSFLSKKVKNRRVFYRTLYTKVEATEVKNEI